ncbi:hypothetical protein KP509_11G073300 [Ceratopteris richardii]|uniref:SBP-type domain-containing protein n=1 Tax=Ceratopteris richardii TaxID=49495 RepID=A0A8T2TTV0_CERRI|nr:hypothetical protein KP509_11G073300 [Ceratopteris richardii]
MNSLTNLNSIGNEQDDPNPWPSDHGWEPPIASICAGAPDSRLHYQQSIPGRQEWDWSDNHMILSSNAEYAADNGQLDCKPMLHVDAFANSTSVGLGLRQYSNAGLLPNTSAAERPSGNTTPDPSVGIATAAATLQNPSWPGVLNALPLRHEAALLEASGGAHCYSPPGLCVAQYAGSSLGAAGINNSSNIGLGAYYNTHQAQILHEIEQRRLHDILKRGIYSGVGDVSGGRLGLNLGGRTYFCSEDLASRYHVIDGGMKRFRPNSPSLHVPSCQAEGCKADLSIAKHYHRRHKVCEYHSKAATVVISGNTQRFCQQCSRFHALTEFDEGKRSCRKRLADHNRRRRKPQPLPALPAPDSTSTLSATVTTTEAATSSIGNPASNESGDLELQDATQKITTVGRESDRKGDEQPKDAMASHNRREISCSIDQQTSSRPPTISAAPSVSLTLQNDGLLKSDMNSAQSSSNMKSEASQIPRTNDLNDPAYSTDRQQTPPLHLRGPNLLSLSTSTIDTNAGSRKNREDSTPSTNLGSLAHVSQTLDGLELSVPWLRGGTKHVQSSPATTSVVQKSPRDLFPLCYQADEDSINSSNVNQSSAENEKYLSDQGRLLLKHMQSLHSEVSHSTRTQDNHQSTRKKNWMQVESSVVPDGQTALALLETATTVASRKEPHEYNGQMNILSPSHHHRHRQLNRHHFIEQTYSSSEETGQRRHSFLEQHLHAHYFHEKNHQAGEHLHLRSKSPSHGEHDSSDHAALSQHCMQALRPLNESLYTTADFMKDGFV